MKEGKKLKSSKEKIMKIENSMLCILISIFVSFHNLGEIFQTKGGS